MTQHTHDQTMTTQRILGLDIGGANIKLASHDGHYVRSIPFPMWSRSATLKDTIRDLLCTYQTEQGRFDALAVTMTGELADCFTSKQQGVLYIVQATSAGAAAASDSARVFFYETGGQWSMPRQAQLGGIHSQPPIGMPWLNIVARYYPKEPIY